MLLENIKRKKKMSHQDKMEFVMECLVTFVATITPLAAFLYTIIFLVEKIEVYHRFVNTTFGTNVSFQLKYLPLMLHVCFQTFLSFNTVSYCCTVSTLFLYSTIEWLNVLITQATRTSKARSGRATYPTALDVDLIRTYRMIQILTRIVNVVGEKFWVGFHHAALLGIAVLCFFGSIRWSDKLSFVTVGGFLFGGVICIFLMFVEVKLFWILPVKSKCLLKLVYIRNKRKSIINREIRSCKLVKWEMGKPFYTLSNFSFLIFMEQLMSFLFTLLLSVP